MNAFTCLVGRHVYKHWRALALTMLFAFGCTAVHAQETSLYMYSDPGDYIGQGQTYYYTPADGSFTAQKNYDQGVSLSFNTPNYSHWWYLDFAGANSQPLTVGTYTGALRFPFQGSAPGLNVDGDGRGCNTLTGTFTVLEVSYGTGNTIQSFDATFEQHCEGATPALYGEIRYNATVNVSLSAPTHVNGVEGQAISFTVNATDLQNENVSLSASGLPAGASFVDNGNNTGTFSWTPSSAQAGSYNLTFEGQDQQGNIGKTYTTIKVTAPPPPNDDISNATVVPYMPFTDSENVTNATAAATDPSTCYGRYQTVWYEFTPQNDVRIEANTVGSSYDTTLAVFTGSPGALTQLGCNDDAGGAVTSRVIFDAKAGTTYYVMVGSLYPTTSANLVFNLEKAPPPLSIVPTVYQFGTVELTTGAVSVAGAVTCNKPAYVYIMGQIKQVRAGVPISGQFFTAVACTGTTPWKASVMTQSALFKGRASALFTGGKANVAARAYAFDPDSGAYVQRNFEANTILRGSR